jgi:small subunit ribosomal protein S9
MAGVVYSATGKRKTSVARVRLMPGTGNIIVNGKDLKEYFNRQTLMLVVRSPLVETGTEARYDVIAQTHGGGKSGQAGALKHGLARALVEADPSLRTEVKRAGHLSRDARMVERKKAGLKKARKRPQFSKR